MGGNNILNFSKNRYITLITAYLALEILLAEPEGRNKTKLLLSQ